MITSGLVSELIKIAAPERVTRDEPLSGHCSFRTGGPADLFIQVCTEEELEKIGAILKTYGVAKVSDLPAAKYEAFLTDISQI